MPWLREGCLQQRMKESPTLGGLCLALGIGDNIDILHPDYFIAVGLCISRILSPRYRDSCVWAAGPMVVVFEKVVEEHYWWRALSWTAWPCPTSYSFPAYWLLIQCDQSASSSCHRAFSTVMDCITWNCQPRPVSPSLSWLCQVS